MPAFVKTDKDEKRWKAAKHALANMISKPESEWGDKDWARVTGLYKKIKKQSKK